MRSRIFTLAVLVTMVFASQPNSLFAGTGASAETGSPIVIIHGAWGGAHHWKTVADSLTHKHNRTVRRASLTGLGERSHLATSNVNLDTHIKDVVNLIEFDDLQSVVLIGHSYGGLVAQGVVNAIPKRLAQVIYIDSNFLEDGECYLTNHPEKEKKFNKRANEAGKGWLIPVDWKNPMRDTPHPLATLKQIVNLDDANQDRVPGVYWLLADGEPAEEDERSRYHYRAGQRGLMTKIYPWRHNPHRDIPDELVDALVETIEK